MKDCKKFTSSATTAEQSQAVTRQRAAGRAAAYSHMAQTEELSAARMRTPRIYPSVTHTPWPACAGSVQSVLE